MKCDLINIFNHQYEANISLLEHYYKGRFNRIWHLSPFSQSTLAHIIPVYDGSFTFQNFVANAWRTLASSEADYFAFVSDDLLLDPLINQSNIKEHFNLVDNGAFISVLHDLTQAQYGRGVIEVKRMQKQSHHGLEYESHIPTIEEARQLISRHVPVNNDTLWNYPPYNVTYQKPYLKHIRTNWKSFKAFLWHQRERIKHLVKPAVMPYPVIGGNADIFVIHRHDMPAFAHLCGVFSAMRLFVELAIPTAMAISCQKISTEHDTRRRGINYVKVWQQQEIKQAFELIREIENNAECNIDNLSRSWPSQYLYLHPIKLSKWHF
jgi:hypothetical protein